MGSGLTISSISCDIAYAVSRAGAVSQGPTLRAASGQSTADAVQHTTDEAKGSRQDSED